MATPDQRDWSSGDLEFLRANYFTMTGPALAAALGKPLSACYQRARKLGLRKATIWHFFTPEEDAKVKELAGEGYCNKCIGRILGHARCGVRHARRRLGLPDLPQTGMQATCKTCIEKVRATTREQCRKAGVANLAQVRGLVYRKYVEDSGWPADLRPRQVQILNALAMLGPLTRIQMAKSVGYQTTNPKKIFHSKYLAGGSYLANLMQRGMVICLGRIVRTGRKGGNLFLYTLAPDIQRFRVPHNERMASNEAVQPDGPDAATAGVGDRPVHREAPRVGLRRYSRRRHEGDRRRDREAG